MEPLRQKSLFWHNIWVNCGWPRDGNLAGIMRRTRAAYHAAVKRVKRNEKDITRKAESLASHNTRDFWSKVKKITGSKKGCANVVDGICDAANIANHFGDIYDKLYHCVSFSQSEMVQFRHMLNDMP